MSKSSSSRVIVVGSGVAGLSCALTLSERGHEVVIVTKARTSDSATFYAQGGIASQWFSEVDDSIESHIHDTVLAGAGLCDDSAVRVLVEESKDAISRLMSRGAKFDQLSDGSLARTLEGGHRNPRIIHSGGDRTGEEVERALVSSINSDSISNISVIDHHMVTRLLIDNGRCSGIVCVDERGVETILEADHVVLSTGGAGQLYSVTTNPLLATADGISLALQSSVLCADLEFMQFHPTALHVDNMPRPLLSEALRGAGAILKDSEGQALMKGVHPMGDLAPRDVVSRQIARVLREQETECVYLDARGIIDFEHRYPTIYSSCMDIDLDPRRDMIPVSPAAHYYCGGVVTDLSGATSMPHLWAAGEVACNGVHGANRLASNSLVGWTCIWRASRMWH
jgi:L-aspartate oxidase